MKKLLIEKIFRNEKDKNGQPLVNKNGKSYVRLTVVAGGQNYSAFGGTWNDTWKVGDTIDVNVTENGQYKNIEAPKPTDALTARLNELEERIKKLEYITKSLPNDGIDF